MATFEVRCGEARVGDLLASPGISLVLESVYEDDIIAYVVQNFTLARIKAAYQEYKGSIEE